MRYRRTKFAVAGRVWSRKSCVVTGSDNPNLKQNRISAPEVPITLGGPDQVSVEAAMSCCDPLGMSFSVAASQDL